MVLVFILCAIIALITLLIFITILSTIRIKIEDFNISNIDKKEISLPKIYKIIISLYLFNKIKWFSIKLNNRRMKKIFNKVNFNKMDLRKMEKNFKISNLKELKKLQLKISYLDFGMKVGTEDVILTSFIIFTLSTLISIILPHIIKKYEKDKYNYEILPLYYNKNVYQIKFDCIIEVKMVHIINIVYVFLKKRRVDSNEQRTSNRGAYGYSYE